MTVLLIAGLLVFLWLESREPRESEADFKRRLKALEEDQEVEYLESIWALPAFGEDIHATPEGF